MEFVVSVSYYDLRYFFVYTDMKYSLSVPSADISIRVQLLLNCECFSILSNNS